MPTHWLDTVRTECRHAVRALVRRPAFTLLALAVLTLGIAANTAIFALTYAALLRPLPYDGAERMYWIESAEPNPSGEPVRFSLTAGQYAALLEAGAVDGIAAIQTGSYALTGDAEARLLNGGAITSGLFAMIGVAPALGREFTADEQHAGSGVAMISYALWQQRFGGAPDIIGRTVRLDGEPRTIVGVAPAGFVPLLRTGDVWLPLPLTAADRADARRGIEAVIRLAPTASLEQTLAQLQRANQAVAAAAPNQYRNPSLVAIPLRDRFFGDQRAALLLTVCAAALILLIASSNLASLTLAQAVARDHETRVRLALGASAVRLSAARVLQAGLLATAALVLALPVAQLLITPLRAMQGESFTLIGAVSIADRPVLLFALGVALAGGMLMGIVPAVRDLALARRAALLTSVRGASASFGAARMRAGMLTAQVALAIVLLSGASVLMRTLGDVLGAEIGFEPANVVTAELQIADRRYPTPEQRALLLQQLADELRALPGVESVATTGTDFLAPNWVTQLEIQGVPATREQFQIADLRHVLPDYFSLLRVRQLAGRTFTANDRIGAVDVAVVNRAFAEQYGGIEGVIGTRIRRGGTDNAWIEIVGVVENVRDMGLTFESRPMVYYPYLQTNSARIPVTLLIRTAGDPALLGDGLRGALARVDPDQPIARVALLEELLDRSVAHTRFQTLFVTAFAGAGALLSLLGLYALTLHSVVQRRRELAIRRALGAQQYDVFARTLRGALAPVAIGLLAGTAATVALDAVVRRTLLDTRLFDPLLLALVAAGLLACAVVASVRPALQAARVHPGIVLRDS